MDNATKDIAETLEFTPKYNENGLIPCITTSARDGSVLMFAWMNREALAKTIETGEVHYWSRSRNELWHKGKTSGQVQKVIEMRTDCDQDCLLMKVETPEPETACHTGRRSCFYRVVKSLTSLTKQ
jgi:phosphoribosyl-AMP cyclohydrolase